MGFHIVRAIAVSEVPPERIQLRDGKTYFAVLLDNSNRKPIVRPNLNGKSVKFVTTLEKGTPTPSWPQRCGPWPADQLIS